MMPKTKPETSASASGRGFVLVGQRVAAQRPGRESEEGESGQQGDPVARKGFPGCGSDQHGRRMNRCGRHRDPRQDRPGAIAAGQGHGHQLRLVSEFGHENHAETQQEGVHGEGSLSVGETGRTHHRRGAPSTGSAHAVPVEGLAHP
jgi:hypothetical protein